MFGKTINPRHVNVTMFDKFKKKLWTENKVI